MEIKNQILRWFKSIGEEKKELEEESFLDNSSEYEKKLEKLCNSFDLETKFHLLKPLIRSKIDFELLPIPDESLKIGQSKVGGKPDLSNTIEWPTNNANKSLSFIGQLNFEELFEYDTESLLPKSGLLSFFYCADQEAWGFDPNDADRFKLVYTESTENIQRIDFPNDLENTSIFGSNKLSFKKDLSLPGWEHHSIEAMFSDEEIEDYIQMNNDSSNQVLGYANCVQGPMELDCELVTNGIYCGDPTGYENPKRKKIESGKEDWILLFQIDSEEENAGMLWGDSGKLYFWIRKQDLKSKNFDKAWFSLQCY